MVSLLILSTLIILGQSLFSDVKTYYEGQPTSTEEIIEKVSRDEDAVVMIRGQELNRRFYDWEGWRNNNDNGYMVQSTQGTGFVASEDGKILTNKHVVSNQEARYTVITKNGLEYRIEEIERDPNNDVAVIKIDPEQHPGVALETVDLGDSNKIKSGEEIVAMGDDPGEIDPKIQSGKITKLGETIIAGDTKSRKTEKLNDVIETDLGLVPGNSGSPLFNNKGEVIGINTATSTGEDKASFAIPINPAKEFLEQVE